jgi:hypothetical protein
VRRALAAYSLVVTLAAPAAAQSGPDTYLLAIVGLGGDPENAAAFDRWAAALVDAACDRDGLAKDHVVYLGEDPSRDPARIGGRSTKENIEAAFARIAARARPGDRVFVVLIGHGGSAGVDARFNLPGPDMTAKDFAAQLGRLSAQQVVFVNTASASGGFIPALSGRDRTIVTATKTDGERNQTRFGEFLVEAFTGTDADLDKDGRVSVLEAFVYARRRVAETYQKAGQLLTEHAVLDDNGDGKGSDEPGQPGADGALARTLFVEGGGASGAAAPQAVTDPALRALYEERRALEDRIGALRAAKGRMDAAQYEQELEKLLLDLAKKTREIREREKKSAGPSEPAE